ncbi:adhesion G protein-coupled receptor L3-like, partial [Diadema antillarum]|uniref:adhesion G protein-coupled receptor L3-like n=1 Tax=Diadema antillarum TaxID=105358 RepID=UPI003A879DF7
IDHFTADQNRPGTFWANKLLDGLLRRGRREAPNRLTWTSMVPTFTNTSPPTQAPSSKTTTPSGCLVDCPKNETTTRLSPSAAVPDPDPELSENVTQVLQATQNSSRFASPDFVSKVETWLVEHNEIPDDFDDDERFDYAKDFLGVCSNVFNVDLIRLNRTEAASKVADSCSSVAESLTSDLDAGESLDISRSNIDVHAEVETTLNFTGFLYSFEGEDENDADDDQVVSISQNIVDDLGLTGDDTIGITVVLYKNGHYISGHDNDTIETNDRPAGPVVSISVAVNKNLTSVPVAFKLPNYLAHLDIKNDAELGVDDFKCVFFDKKSDGRGEWSDFGCQVQNANRNFTVCSCNHTTHFGVLLQVNEAPPLRPADELALSLITYIVGGISLACLLVTIFILNYLSSLNSDRVRIHKNLVSALTVAQALFMCVSLAGRHNISCRLVTLFLHYFYLAVFSWSLLEGVNLYVQIVKVFSTGKSAKYWHYLLFGWGIPLPIVVTSAAVRWKIYGANGICWPTFEKGLSWSFAGPVAVVILMNFIILFMVVRIIVASAAAVKTDNFEHIKAGVKGALLLVPILGLSWVFGFLSLGGTNIVFTYVFVIAVGLQGILIFLLYCVFNSEVRAAMKRKREKRKLRRGDGISTGPTPSTTRSKETNETSSTFTSRLLERMKRRKSSVTGRRSTSPVDTIHLVDRSAYAHSTKDIQLLHKPRGSTDSGSSQNPIHTPRTLPSDSMASIRTESLLADEYIPPHTPTYENETHGVP